MGRCDHVIVHAVYITQKSELIHSTKIDKSKSRGKKLLAISRGTAHMEEIGATRAGRFSNKKRYLSR
jgi:hypothetical protein